MRIKSIKAAQLRADNVVDDDLEALMACLNEAMDGQQYLSQDASSKTPLELSPDAISALYSLAFHLYENGKYTDSKDVFRLLTLSDPFDCRFWLGLGSSHQRLKEYLEAIECYSVAAVQKSDDPYVHLHAADCFFAIGDTEKAIRTLDSSIEVATKSDQGPLLDQLQRMRKSWVDGPFNALSGDKK